MEEVVIKARLMLHLSYSCLRGWAVTFNYSCKKRARTLLMQSQRRQILTKAPRMKIKQLTTRLIMLAAITLITAGLNAQTPEQNVNVTIRPSQTVEQRVADEIKATELKEAAEERSAA